MKKKPAALERRRMVKASEDRHPKSTAFESQPVAGSGQPLVPAPIMSMLRRQFPRLVHGVIEGDDVFLAMTDRKGRLEAVRYRASAEFLTAVRVADSGLDNHLTLCGKGGFKIQP